MLPKNVNAVKDRHGRTRYRFRKAGLPSRYLPAPGHPDFSSEYASCLEGRKPSSHVPKRKKRIRLSAMRGVEVVYFIGVQSGLIKIGTTTDLPERLKKLQTGCPFKMKLLAVTPGGAELESKYHARFAEFRERGEWFKGAPVREEVDRLKGCDWCPTYYPGKVSNHAKILKCG